MNAASIAAILTAAVALIGALTGLITALRKPSTAQVHEIAKAKVQDALNGKTAPPQ